MQRFLSTLAVTLLFFFSPARSIDQTASQDRIPGNLKSAERLPLPGSVHPLAASHVDRGRSDPSRLLASASLVFRLSPLQQSALDRLLQQQQDPSSPLYHRWISSEEYGRRFGLSDNDLATVSSWLASQGLKVESVSPSRTEIFFTGSVRVIENAFQTEIHEYSSHGERHFANAVPLSLPSALAAEVLGVRGLSNFPPRSHLNPAPRFTSSLSGNHFLIPGDFATIYNLAPLYQQGLDGSGQKIAVVGQTAINLSDIRAFRTASGLAQNDPSTILVPGTGASTSCSGDVTEADLDIEWSGAVAKNASIIYVYTGLGTGSGLTCKTRTKNAFDALFYAINHTPLIAPVISVSYGNCEKLIGSSNAKIFQQWAKQANSQGQSLVAAAGDDGAADCDSSTASATQGLAVDVPASIPEVTGVGGTEFTGDPAAVVPAGSGCAPATTFWGQSCSPGSGASALSYIPETSWNDGVIGGTFSSGGGGASNAAAFFAKPSWQTGPGVPSDGSRDVPDLALNASSSHDPYLICSQGGCVSGFRDSSNNLTAVGGTSAGAPTFAGVIAIINQATQTSGQGNVNPILYSLAVSSPSAFHDIQSGNNKVPCTTGTPNCPSGGTIGFTAGANYDQVAGLGTLDAFNLVTAWPGFISTPGYTVTAAPASLTIPNPGKSSSSIVSVNGSNGFVGAVALSCAVPASATTKVSCTVSPSSVSLDTTNISQTATLGINALASAGAMRASKLQFFAAGLLLPGVLLLWLPRAPKPRRRNGRASKVLSIVSLLLLGISAGCGGGSSSPATQSQNTSATYAVTVTATSGATSHSTVVSVTVQ
jgi:subtilase family serine protease